MDGEQLFAAQEAADGDLKAAPDRDRIGEIIHSEPIQHILGVPPHWLARWGSVAMACIIGMLAALTWLIHYPDVVPASVIITTPTPPATVVARATGHLETLTVHDGDTVAGGEVLARIHSSADPQAVTLLQGVVAGWRDGAILSDSQIAALAALPLGELQTDFAAVARANAAYSWQLAADPTGAQLHALEAQRQPLEDRAASLGRQRALLERETTVADQAYQRVVTLEAHQDASKLTLDDREHIVLEAKRALETLRSDEANTRLDLARVNQAITDFSLHERQQQQDLHVALREAVKTLGGRLAAWERLYVLRAPISGTVSLSHFWTNNQFVKEGEDVMAIVPAQVQAPMGRILLPINRAGTVHVGQTVFVRLDNYPGERFGLLKGQVSLIAPVPLAARYAVTMALPNGLITTFGQHLAYQQEMQGQAEIVVEDLRVIDRIFYQFRHMLQSHQDPAGQEPGQR
jgi:multidrug efflux pump subunit AcrA (membrane-fusion protein)